ncbi:hypothetical protein Tco_0201224 [Tanacetum coccineum]
MMAASVCICWIASSYGMYVGLRDYWKIGYEFTDLEAVMIYRNYILPIFLAGLNLSKCKLFFCSDTLGNSYWSLGVLAGLSVLLIVGHGSCW